MSDETPTPSDETEKERVDRELIEFLNEVRVVLPGVQVLFAFLLTLPFMGTFADIDGIERIAYNVAFFSTALAAVLMITPSSFHRLRFRKGDKDYLVRRANRLAIAGLTLLALAMALAVVLVTDYLFGVVTTVVTAAVIAAWFGAFWYLAPLRRLREIGAL